MSAAAILTTCSRRALFLPALPAKTAAGPVRAGSAALLRIVERDERYAVALCPRCHAARGSANTRVCTLADCGLAALRHEERNR